MNTFPLKIVTPDGLLFDGQAQELVVRTTTGDMGILAGHINCVAPLGMGQAMILGEDGTRRYGACIGGMVSVIDGSVSLVPTTFEWADEIDLKRAEAAQQRAQATINNQSASDVELQLAQARLKRALIRSSVAKNRHL